MPYLKEHMLPVHSSFVLGFAGIALFMLGMRMASENLQKLAANRIRDLIGSLAKKPYLGILLGIGLTIILQSSGAVTSMLVGLGSARVITLQQVMSVILGTAIGSTFTVQILSLDIAQYGLAFFAIGFFVQFLARKRQVKAASSVIMGFGLMFWGLELLQHGTEQLKHVETFGGVLSQLKENPFLAIVITSIFTAVVQSSAVTIGLAMSLAGSGLLSLHDTIYWVFGANIGTTATALIAAIGGNYVGRQVAWAHCFYKLVSVAIFLPFAERCLDLIASNSIQRDVANFHTVFNLLAAIIFFPGIRKGAVLVERYFPPSAHELDYSVKFLKKKDWESPSVVIAHAEREVLRLADVVMSMVESSLDLFRNENPELIEATRKRDDRADLLAREINLYLAQHLEEAPEPHQIQMMRIMNYATDLEAAADVVDNQLLELASKKHHLKVEFSAEGWSELEEMHRAVSQIASLSMTCFQRQDMDLAAKVIFHKRNVRKLEKRMRESHISRLVKGRPESINTSSIHFDVLGEYRRLVGLLSNHVYSVLKENDPYNLLPRRES